MKTGQGWWSIIAITGLLILTGCISGSAPPKSAPPPPTAPPGAGPSTGVQASRAFFEPHNFPPVSFLAYGIFAFPERAISGTRDRHLMFCEAYLASLPHVVELDIPRREQMVTVWPVNTKELANELNESAEANRVICEKAVDGYHLPTAQKALADAKRTGTNVDGRGPYLLAWSPASSKGEPDTVVLRADLSGLTNHEQALEVMRGWRTDIQQNPELWQEGWSVESLRIKIRNWADRYGAEILALFGN